VPCVGERERGKGEGSFTKREKPLMYSPTASKAQEGELSVGPTQEEKGADGIKWISRTSRQSGSKSRRRGAATQTYRKSIERDIEPDAGGGVGEFEFRSQLGLCATI